MNPSDAEVRLVHAQQHCRLRPDRALVVGGARAIRRPHLDEPRTRPHEHVGDAKAVADLDELAARDDHLAPLRERGEREENGGRVVVDDERRLRTGQAPEERPEVILARPSLAPLEVVLEVRVAGADLGHAGERCLGERCAAEIRVDEDAGRIQHAPKRRLPRAADLDENGVDDRSWIRAGLDLVPRLLENGPRGRQHELAGLGGEPLVAEQLVHGGQVAKLHAESVGTSSRRSAVSDPAADAPTASTAS